MGKIIAVLIAFVVLGGGVYWFNNKGVCLGSGVTMSGPSDTQAFRGQPVSLRMKLVRDDRLGCTAERVSEAYQEVGCGYRIAGSEDWEVALLAPTSDQENEYEVECLIPDIPAEARAGTKIEYYFDFALWEKTPERKTGTLTVQ